MQHHSNNQLLYTLFSHSVSWLSCLSVKVVMCNGCALLNLRILVSDFVATLQACIDEKFNIALPIGNHKNDDSPVLCGC